jgi:uncharacterized membrane protein YoaK (UPF0700 family)
MKWESVMGAGTEPSEMRLVTAYVPAVCAAAGTAIAIAMRHDSRRLRFPVLLCVGFVVELENLQ